MDRRKFLGGLVLGALGLTAGAGAALADHDRWDYRRFRYHAGRDGDERRRREILKNRLFWMAERTRTAERENFLSRSKARELYNDLDDVRDFLRDDRYLTESEFRRRMDDLEDVEDDLQDAFRRRGRGYDRFHDSRYSGRYDRSRGGYDRSRGPEDSRYRGRGDDDDRYRGRDRDDDDDRYYRR
jgi:hypothetical protein